MLLVEANLTERKNFAVIKNCFGIKKILTYITADNVLLYDAGSALGCSLAVEGAFGINDNDRTESTVTEAACLNNQNVVAVVSLKLVFKSLNYLTAA